MSSPAMHKFDVKVIAGTITNTSITMSESLVMGTSDTVSASNNRVVKAADPINDQDLTTKKYVDDIVNPPFTATLTGTATTVISTAVKGNFLIFVTNAGGGAGPSTNGPGATFSIAKREAVDVHVCNMLSGVAGMTTGESLSIVWNISEGVKLKKSGAGYNGTYRVVVIGSDGS